MQPDTMVKALAASRFGVGMFMLVRPRQAMHSWIGDDADRPRTQMLIRSFGVRDGMLGLGALIAMRRGQPARGWIEAGLASDLVDFAVTLVMLRRLPKPGAYAVLATAAAAAGIGIYAAPRTGGESDRVPEERWRTAAAAD